jgi:nitroreductase
MDALEALKTRRSHRAFKPDAVPKEILEQMIDCGRLAATGRNAQPWVFIVITDETIRKQLADVMVHSKFAADSGVCVVVFCEEVDYYLEDGSAAIQNIMVAGRALGIDTCWIAGGKQIYEDAARKLLGVPNNHRLVGIIPVGYATDSPSPQKKSLDEVLHWQKYGGK